MAKEGKAMTDLLSEILARGCWVDFHGLSDGRATCSIGTHDGRRSYLTVGDTPESALREAARRAAIGEGWDVEPDA